MGKMTLQHGTDREGAVEAFYNGTLTGDDYHDDYGYCEEVGIDPQNVIYLAEDASMYAEIALVTIEVDEEDVVQISDDEYVMAANNPYYEVVEVAYQNTATLKRDKTGVR